MQQLPLPFEMVRSRGESNQNIGRRIWLPSGFVPLERCGLFSGEYQLTFNPFRVGACNCKGCCRDQELQSVSVK
eukprot:5353664-Amphidinium_carterae.1